MKKPNDIILKDTKVIFKNFSGAPTKFNSQGGVRMFSAVLEPEVADELIAQGWNVKSFVPNGEEFDVFYLPVAVTFGEYPPVIFMVTENKTLLDEVTVDLLDASFITRSDMIINASVYDVNGKQGIKAYLKKGFFTIEQDELDDLYSDVPMSGQATYVEE